ncbi:hypothetical protein QC823_15400 [Halomonas vilamensis]|uniref:Uncharacterized protein n=1 Tax=Vreelandella vilamensis TaxID=531309 RepID=A0ABU1H7S1_9GAMM|nr:hypothetical protein [Halomonas vilamensis]MDR5900350.1 hypothetical protein [Halomonas vilamensis]
MKGFLALMAGIAVLAVIALGIGPKSDRICNSEAEAYEFAKTTINRGLIAPSEAQWPKHSEATILKTDEGECRYKIFGHLDAQNGFGAMIRRDYFIEIDYKKESGRWELIKLER